MVLLHEAENLFDLIRNHDLLRTEGGACTHGSSRGVNEGLFRVRMFLACRGSQRLRCRPSRHSCRSLRLFAQEASQGLKPVREFLEEVTAITWKQYGKRAAEQG